MRTQLIDLDEHACLWPDLTVHTRHVAGPEDVAVGTHPVLGLCVVSRHGFSPLVEWMTREAILDNLIEFETFEHPKPAYTPFKAAVADLIRVVCCDAT